MSLIFYDIETSGRAKGFDQILQFAAMRTDPDVVTVTDAFEVRSRLLPHVIPSPGALKVTGISIEQLLDAALPSHYDMIGRICETVGAWRPGVFVGYNSLRFDEEFLRHAFYQCLRPPYLTNTGGAGRADALHLMRAAVLLDPEVLTVPLGENGKPSFKLDRLAPANEVAHQNAHDAMADVEAMISLCRRVRDRQPDLWARLAGFAHKGRVTEFLAEHQSFLVIEAAAGQGAANVVVQLGANPGQNSLIYALDLRCDVEALKGLDDEALAKRLARYPKLVRRVKANAAPILFHLDEAPARLLGDLTAAEARQRAELVLGDPAFVARLIQASVEGETVYPPSPHVEVQLYDGGFWSRGDERLMAAFHQALWERRPEIAAAFEDRRLRALARRLIYFDRPDLMSAAERARWDEAIARRGLVEGEEPPPWTTVPQALGELEVLLAQDLPTGARAMLAAYETYLHRRLAPPKAAVV